MKLCSDCKHYQKKWYGDRCRRIRMFTPSMVDGSIKRQKINESCKKQRLKTMECGGEAIHWEQRDGAQ